MFDFAHDLEQALIQQELLFEQAVALRDAHADRMPCPPVLRDMTALDATSKALDFAEQVGHWKEKDARLAQEVILRSSFLKTLTRWMNELEADATTVLETEATRGGE